MFLEEVLRYVNNRFEMETVYDTFSISGGTLEIPDCLDGQYFWVEGSALNDGLHLYPDADMADEDFVGRVVLLAIPRPLVDLADEIEAWSADNADAIGGPYQSESFGGYSYTLASGGAQGNETPAAAWHVKFGARLRPYRKLSRDWV